jgi:hypothetical protein
LKSSQLEQMKFAPLEWLVRDVLPADGVILLAGEPKAGKTRLMTHIATKVATGGKVLNRIDSIQCGVLFLYLEEGWRLIKKRLDAMFPSGWPKDLYFANEWPRMGQGGRKKLDSFLTSHPQVKLVVIDTFVRFRPLGGSRNIYERDHAQIMAMKSLMNLHNTVALVSHHTNKLQEARSIFDRISGSQGLAAAADTLALLDRESRLDLKVSFSVRGREVEDRDLALEHDPDTGEWTLLGDANLYIETHDSRLEYIEYLKEHPGKAPSEVADALEKNRTTTRRMLGKMLLDGQVAKDGESKYYVVDDSVKL